MRMEKAAEELRQAGDKGIGVDVESVNTFRNPSSVFLERNFTAAELAYCRDVAPDTAASLAGRWCAKEAVLKAISSAAAGADGTGAKVLAGASAPLRDVEIIPTRNGAPHVVLHGRAAALQRRLGLETLKVSISHVSECAVAQAVAR